ncbi:MAG: hypothetical protein A2527_14435 [Candidatus Lambdaproteobacteria bacterium RIFOXYD2_FULL_50_16]|uniref:Uncharacterized protein n=1 Tax=Candidatus Lambdaproteobacteria bacterium RIFOXYD2_FULL_50_16 TaxID=1817772 RepID=A0A1F6G4T1_9PROT|nr:MAG: hypothetical protein A2527_14435 [Candidatus Lambdaproteobacteria bacterium RIFOXYD2_FULL_50_16]
MYISALYLLFDPRVEDRLRGYLVEATDLELMAEEGQKMILTLESTDEPTARRRLSELEALPGVLGVQVSGFYVS